MLRTEHIAKVGNAIMIGFFQPKTEKRIGTKSIMYIAYITFRALLSS
jgi:hypothetical protein